MAADDTQEATRVTTPPLKEDTIDGRVRGLFFDISGPSESDRQQGSESTSSTRGTLTNNSSTWGNSTVASQNHHQSRRNEHYPRRRREWWDTPSKSMTSAASAAAASRKNQMRKAALFEFNVPEHLPTSPMCPANPKNKSEGKGVCVVSHF